VNREPKRESNWHIFLKGQWAWLLYLVWIGVISVLARILVDYFLAPYAFYVFLALGVCIALIIARALWKIFHADGPTTLKLK
jgi:uncharacterized membrane protein (DUF373 family)